MEDVRIGIIGTDNTHAYTYSAYINGWAEDEPIPVRLGTGTPVPDMYLWAMQLRRLENEPRSGVPVPGARVTSIWSADHADAERIAKACDIAQVRDEPEDVCRDVDAVMVLSERPETHLPYARPALERGLRTYVDKPFAENSRTGAEIFALAKRHGAPCFTGSGVRWSPEFLAARDQMRGQPGDLRALHVQCPLGLELYGIHAIELVNLFLGHDIVVVEAIRGPNRQVVLLTYRDDRTAVLEHLNFLRWPTYSATGYADTWHHRAVIDDPAPTALAFVRTFVDFARGGETPVSEVEALRLIEVLGAAEQSARTGRSIRLE